MTETSGDAYTQLVVAGETVTGPPEDILTAVQAALEIHDPDILVCSMSGIMKHRRDVFHDGVLSNDVIPLTAALAAQKYGDARKSIEILRHACVGRAGVH